MEILKFEDAPAPKRAASKKRGVNSSRETILGIAAAAAIAVVGSTLAANISINTGGSLEFGQGLTATAACSNGATVTMTPTSTFSNGSGTAGNFYLSGITFSNTGLLNCSGKTFTIQAWDNASASPLVISTTSGTTAWTSATFAYSSSAGTPVTSYSGAITSVGGTSGSTATVAFGTGTGDATAGQIYKLTLQSQ